MTDLVKNDSLKYKLYAIPGRALVAVFEWLIRLTSPNLTFFPLDKFPWTQELEKNWQEIRQELETVLQQPEALPEFKSISPEQARISQGAPWSTFILYAYGNRIDENCSKCPKTDALVKQIPDMKTAMFSVFNPTTHLTPHRGPLKGLMRYHLALKVPLNHQLCGLRVGEETRHWEEGKSLIFDDTFEHEAWNQSEDIRVILFVDFLRDLPWPLSFLNRGIVKLFSISPFIQNIVKSLEVKKAPDGNN